MDTALLYALGGVLLFTIGLHGLIAHAHLIRKIIAVNVMGPGVFLILVAMAKRSAIPDPIPHALVLTGIVVAVSATALALVLALHLHAATGKCVLPESDEPS